MVTSCLTRLWFVVIVEGHAEVEVSAVVVEACVDVAADLARACR
jgi:hypothetical protein